MKKIEILFLFLIFPIITAILSFALKINLMISIILFYGIPSLYISLKIKKEIKKAAIFSLLVIPIALVIDSLGHINNMWFVPTIFPFRIFGSAIEVIIWSIFTVYFITMFYEYFLNKHMTKKAINSRMKYLIIFAISLLFLFIATLFLSPKILSIPYAHLTIGVIFIFIPIIAEMFIYKKLATKFIITAVYFFYFHFIYEIAGLKLGWWNFPESGQFIGNVSILGVSFPFEELFFFIMLSALAVISFFEFFDDDNK